jgi:hypothetical protein
VQEAEVALLNEVLEGHPARPEALGNGDHESEVRLDEGRPCRLARHGGPRELCPAHGVEGGADLELGTRCQPRLHRLREAHLVLRPEEVDPTDLRQVGADDVPSRLRRPDCRTPHRNPPAPNAAPYWRGARASWLRAPGPGSRSTVASRAQ